VEKIIDKFMLASLAKQYFILDSGLSESNLIRKIQHVQGHAECFATQKTTCDQVKCLWRADCMGKNRMDEN